MEKALRHAGLFLFVYFVYVLAIAEISFQTDMERRAPSQTRGDRSRSGTLAYTEGEKSFPLTKRGRDGMMKKKGGESYDISRNSGGSPHL